MKILFPNQQKTTFMAIVMIIAIAGISLTILNRFNDKPFVSTLFADQTAPSAVAKSDGLSAVKLPEGNAPELIKRTINRIEQLHSISADISLETYMFGETYTGKGKYEELISKNEYLEREKVNPEQEEEKRRYVSRPSPLEWSRFRLHLKMIPNSPKVECETEEAENIMEVVCDLRSLWIYTRIEGIEDLSNLGIEDLANSLNRLTEKERTTLISRGVERPCGMSGLPGLGGISGMLKEILVTYDFNSAPEDFFFNSGHFPVWKLVGTMKPENRERLIGKEPSPPVLEVAPLIVEVYIGKKTPFPYRIRYYTSQNSGESKNTLLFSLDFNPVYENDTSIEPKNFVYGPPPLIRRRINDDYLRRLIPGIEL